MRLIRTSERGDTLIEVLFAITVFSLVVVTALAIMNQGTAAAQRSLEMTLVTQEIDNQAEALRYLHEAYTLQYRPGYSTNATLTLTEGTGEFYEIVKLANQNRDNGVTQASSFGGTATCPTPPERSFVINTRTGAVDTRATLFSRAATYSKLQFQSDTSNQLDRAQGIWIEAIKSSNTTGLTASAGFIDFHIRACWDAPGLSTPLTLGTIVRLYEPRG